MVEHKNTHDFRKVTAKTPQGPEFITETPYDVLEIPKLANEQDIKMAYIYKVKEYSPELFPEEFIKIRKTYERLLKPESRAEVDLMTLNEIQGEIGFADIETIDASQTELSRAASALSHKAESGNERARAEMTNLLKQRSLLAAGKRAWSRAFDDWNKILAFEPENQEAKRNLLLGRAIYARTLAKSSSIKAAYEEYKRALELDPEKLPLVHNAAIMATVNGDTVGQGKYWKKVLEKWKKELKTDEANEYLKHLVLQLETHFGEVLITPEQPLPVRETTHAMEFADANANAKMAASYIENNQCGRAVRLLEKSIQRGDSDVALFDYLGWAYLNIGRIDEGFQVWQKALRDFDRHPRIKDSLMRGHVHMGKTMYENGHLIPALTHFKKAVGIDSTNVEAYDFLAKIYLQKGDPYSAIDMWNKALKINPKDKQIQKSIRAAKLRTRR